MKNITTLGVDECKALGDPIRATIINILNHKILTADEIAKELGEYNYKKSITAIRHHIDILRDSRLIEVAYTREKRGTLEKYYKSNIKFLGFSDIDIEYDESIINNLSIKMNKLIESINKSINDYDDRCKYCGNSHVKEHVIASIINMALVKVLEKNNMNDLH